MIVNITSTSRNQNFVKMTEEFKEATDKLRKFMFENVYIGSVAKKEEKKAENIVKELYTYILENPNLLPKEWEENLRLDDLDRVVCDYIEGMTDRYAVKKFNEILFTYSI